MAKKLSKEIKIGIAFVISILVLYFGISFLKGVNIFKPSNSYTVVFDDVTDLTPSSPVILNGLQIGLVYSLEMDPSNHHRVMTILNLDKGIKVPKGSTFELIVGTLGGATISFKPDYSETSYYSSDDLIIGKRKSGLMESLSSDMLPQVSLLLPKMDSILVGLQTVVNNPALVQTFNNTELLTSELHMSAKQMNRLVSSLNNDIPQITSNIVTISDDMKGVTSQVKSIDLTTTYNSIDSTLRNIQLLTQKVNSSDNSLGLLMNDRQLYDSITTMLNNASLLLKDVKENPSRYINVKVF